MQKTTAILLLLLLGVSLFTRPLGYLECRLMNKLLPQSASCDCEKILVQADEENVPYQHPPAHFHPDEFFILNREEWNLSLTPAIQTNFNNRQEKPRMGNSNDCWRPPEMFFSYT